MALVLLFEYYCMGYCFDGTRALIRVLLVGYRFDGTRALVRVLLHGVTF